MKLRRNVARRFELLESRHLLAADLIISEFVARNGSTLRDEDGDASDWIEVFNQGNLDVNLADWFLTDDADELDKWRFPSRLLAPAEAVIVFASGKDRISPTGEMHASFRLSGDGEFLALVEPDGETISSAFVPQYPRQVDDVAFGVPMQRLIAAPSKNSAHPIEATLVSHFTFDDSDRLGDDQGAFDSDAQIRGDARFSSEARVGTGALYLDGDGDYLEIINRGTEYASIDNGDGFTFAAWVWVDSVADGNRRLFSLDMEGGPFRPRGWGVGLRRGNTLLATTYGRVDFDEPSGAALEDGEWRHVAYVFDPTQGNVEFFVDGVSSGTRSGTPAGMNESLRTDGYLIGGLNLTSSGNGQFFRGLIDDLRIYDGRLTESQIADLVNQPSGSSTVVRYLVPRDNTVDESWTRNEFDDSHWLAAAGAIGYEVEPGAIGDYVWQSIPTESTSVYVRTSFDVDDPDNIERLILRMRYDDGFVVYLNGTLVSAANAPQSPRYDSLALTDRDESAAVVWAVFDLSEFTGVLKQGRNLLAIHALNDSAESNEFLIVPDLYAIHANGPLYLTEPTPGTINSSGNDFGPLIEQVTHRPLAPTAADALTVTARVSELSSPVAAVSLHYRVMYEPESTIRMNDVGADGDAIAGDGIYTGVIPANVASAGEMVRYYIRSSDTSGRTLREPFLPDPAQPAGGPEYLGTVIADSTVETQLPVLHWFVPDPTWHMRRPGSPSGGNNRDWTTASVFYDGEFYDNIQVRVRGSSTVQNWPKPKFKFEFNDTHEFRYADNQERVDEFNLQSHYIEVLPGAGLGSTAVSYLRETLAFEFLQEIGVPASNAFHMRVQQNGVFYSLASFIEQVDRTFLRRNGFDDGGPMYKATPTVQSTLAPNPNPGIYRKVTQKEEPFDDLRELTNGLNGRIDGVSVEEYIFDNINLPQVINEMAGQTILMNHDRLTKNYYVYRDVNGTGEWSRFPWDVEQAFSDPQWDHFVSVLYGDTEHTQGTGNEPQYPNYLLDAILDTPLTRQMYLQRLRTLMDDFLGDEPGYFEDRIDQLVEMIRADAQRDHAKWRAGAIDNGIAAVKANLAKRREALANDPLVPKRDVVRRDVELLSEDGVVSVLVPLGPEDGVIGGVPWQNGDGGFPDTAENGWAQGRAGIGYDRQSSYLPYISLDVAGLMDVNGDRTNESNGLYARFRFEVTDPLEFDNLELHLRYDDGFVAYINGIEVARDLVPTEIAWDSRATRGREASSRFDVFELPSVRPDGVTPLLVPGTNVLAIHAVNRSVTDSDLLIQPKVIGAIDEPRFLDIRFGDVDTDGIESVNEIVYNPISGNQDEEYISIVNAGNAAVDLSHWRITGGVEFVFQPGTVLVPNGTLYVSPNVSAFRARRTGPSAHQKIFVQGNYAGHLSNSGETLSLLNRDGEVVAQVTIPASLSDVQAYLRVSEIHYNPPGEDDLTEFIEFVNISEGAGGTTLDLSGVTLSDGPSEPFVFAEGLLLPPGERLVVVRDTAAFEAAYPDVDSQWIAGEYEGRLANDGESVKLEDRNGATVLQFSYGDGETWPAAADGVGASLELANAADTAPDEFGKASKWQASTLFGGSPTKANRSSVGVVLNEVLARTADRPGQSDSIELYNHTDLPIDIGGWFLSDSAQQLMKYQIPANTIIDPRGYVVFDEADFNPTPLNPGPLDFSLNGTSGDDVWLTIPDSQGGVSEFVDDFHFGPSLDASFGLDRNGSGQWIPQSRVTLGSQNGSALVGPLLISEVHYNPGDPSGAALAIDPQLTSDDLEFVEIHNPTNTAQSLDGWQLAGGIEYVFPMGLILAADKSLLILSFDPLDATFSDRLAAFRVHYGIDEELQLAGGFRGKLSNSEDLIRLLRPRDDDLVESAIVFVDQVHFGDRDPWPTSADGEGLSLQRVTPSSNGDRTSSWQSEVPTPGDTSFDNAMSGDLTGEGQVDAQDIDLLFDLVRHRYESSFSDLDQNGTVDFQDVDFLIRDLLDTSYGDANLDGSFDTLDLVKVLQVGEYEDDLAGNSMWSDGDWNGDGDFGTADLVVALQEGTYETEPQGRADGDFNRNGVLDAVDIDLLSLEVRRATNNPAFDLNRDRRVNEADRRIWVYDKRKTVFGDANLNGRFDAADFVMILQAGQYEDLFLENSTWSTGDWNGDGDFNSLDLVSALQEAMYEQDAN